MTYVPFPVSKTDGSGGLGKFEPRACPKTNSKTAKRPFSFVADTVQVTLYSLYIIIII